MSVSTIDFKIIARNPFFKGNEDEYKKIKDLTGPGVYIWGFYNENSDLPFIPLYVGESINIIRRLKKHWRDLNSYKVNYKRLECDFIFGSGQNFYNDYKLPKYLKSAKKKTGDDTWFEKYPDHFVKSVYFWSGEISVKKDGTPTYFVRYKDQTKPNKVISAEDIDPSKGAYFSNKNFKDGINIGIHNGQFAVLVWQLSDELLLQHSEIVADIKRLKPGSRSAGRDFREIFEALVKFALKGKTISESASIEQMKEYAKRYGVDSKLSVECSISELYYLFNSTTIDSTIYHDERNLIGYK